MTKNINPYRLLLKSSLIIALTAFVLLPWIGSSIGKISLYNWLLPGRDRLPFSDYPQQAYNLSLYNLEAMYRSHQLTGDPVGENEYRVIILGDSSVWGTLLEPEDTLAGRLNRMDLLSLEGKKVHFYNLGYPTLSLTKDLLLLEKALACSPDLVIWPFTLESFPVENQLASPIVKNNAEAVSSLLDRYGLDFKQEPGALASQTYWEKTLFGQRRDLADIYRLQLYGVMWAITGVDQYYPDEYEPAARDLSDSDAYQNWEPGEMTPQGLALEVLLAGTRAAGEVPIIFINEPILISSGTNSEIRYNYYYPRWAYDSYRSLLNDFTTDHNLAYIDAWDIVPGQEFTNTAIHVSPSGVQLLADVLAAELSARHLIE